MQIHVVTPGQTLYSVGAQYGVPAGILARLNGLREPYALAVGQSLLILRPEAVYTVREGDTLFSVSRRFGVPVRSLLRNNPNLSGNSRLYPGQTLILSLESDRQGTVEVNGYAYPFVTQQTLRGILPYATCLSPFSYGFTVQGTLVPLRDEQLIQTAEEYGVRPLLHLSTLTENGTFSSERAKVVLQNAALTDALVQNAVSLMREKGYRGIDVDFEFLGAEQARPYADFIEKLREAVGAAGGIVVTALAPKTRADQPGVLYEGHDYRRIGESSDAVLLMTYEWGYTYGPPMAVAPVPSVRRVLDYAVTEIPPEKIWMGFPNYAYDWALPYTAGVTRAEVIGNESAPELAVRVGAEIRYDEYSQTPYFHYTAPDGVVHEVWFEDARSSLAKFRLVREYGFRGLGYWNFMRPFAANFCLLNAMFEIA